MTSFEVDICNMRLNTRNVDARRFVLIFNLLYFTPLKCASHPPLIILTKYTTLHLHTRQVLL